MNEEAGKPQVMGNVEVRERSLGDDAALQETCRWADGIQPLLPGTTKVEQSLNLVLKQKLIAYSIYMYALLPLLLHRHSPPRPTPPLCCAIYPSFIHKF